MRKSAATLQPIEKICWILKILLSMLGLGFNQNGKNMRSHISISVIIWFFSLQKAQQNVDQIHLLLEVIHNFDKMAHSCSEVFQDSVDVAQDIIWNFNFSLDFAYHLKHAFDGSSCSLLMLFAGVVEHLSLLRAVGCKKCSKSSMSSSLDHTAAFSGLDFIENLKLVDLVCNMIPLGCRLIAVCEITAVHDDCILWHYFL